MVVVFMRLTMDAEAEYDQFLDALREQQIVFAVLGMPVHHLWAFPARLIGGKRYRQVHAFTKEAGEIIFELRV